MATHTLTARCRLPANTAATIRTDKASTDNSSRTTAGRHLLGSISSTPLLPRANTSNTPRLRASISITRRRRRLRATMDSTAAVPAVLEVPVVHRAMAVVSRNTVLLRLDLRADMVRNTEAAITW